MRAYLSLLPILLLLVSCSGKAPVKAGFQIDLSGLPLTSTQGGLVIFGKNTNGDKFTRVIMTSAGTGLIEEEIPRGTWTFGAVAWDGTKGFTGDISCAFPSAVTFTEDKAAVTLSLSNSNCFHSDVVVPDTFSGSSPKVFAPITTNLCQGDVSSIGSVDCTYSPTIRPIVRGFAGSYKMYIPAGRKYGKVSQVLPGEYIESSCYNTHNNAEPIAAPTYYATELNIPVFKDSVEFPLQVLAFLGSACENIKGVLPRNLTTPSESRLVNSSPGTLNLLNISASISAVCTVSENLPTPNITTAAAGNGTIISPWLICTEEQLNALQTNYATFWGLTQARGGIHVLGRDMNLLKSLETSETSCLREGDTFLPIGKYFSTDYPTCTLSSHTPQGTFKFDGNGKTISYFRFMNSSTNDVGFFSYLTGDAYDINFNRSEVEGGNNTGIVAGTKSGGLLKMITVSNSRVDGGDNTGGLVGINNGASTLYKLFGEKLEVDGKNQTGGLIGHVNTANITDAYFDGTVYTDSNTNNTGGIVGRILGTIESAVSMGVIRSGGTRVGGIAGQANNIKFVRSDVQLHDYDTDLNDLREFGGIVGFQPSGNGVENSLFMGNITTGCNDGACDVGAITGAGDTAPVDTFSTWSGPADGYNGAGTYNLGSIFGSGAANAICNGAPGCTVIQTTGDKPRISTLETGSRLPACSRIVNFASLATQDSAGRGTSTNPFMICNPNQLPDMATYPGEYFVLGDHINLGQYAALELGNFNGILDGNNHFLFGFKDLTANSDSALFDTIVTDSIIRNLTITGTKIHQTGCSSGPCLVGSLALTNSGSLYNVNAEDIDIQTNDENVQSGGIVSYNTQIISGSHVFGSIRSQNGVGGIAYANDGKISDSRSDVRIDGMDAASNTGYFGGIVGVNSSTLSRNRYKGFIQNIMSATRVGGIAGVINPGSVQEDNEFSRDASIEIDSTTSAVGGIAGFASAAGAILRRNLSAGTIYGTAVVPSAKSLVGSGTFSADPNGLNYQRTVAQVYIENGDGSGAIFSGAPDNICSLSITQSTGNTDQLGISGMVKAGMKYYHGTLDDIGATYTFTTTTRDLSSCNDLNNSLDIYASMSESAQNLSVATLKGNTYGWDIVDMRVPAERTRAFNAYREILQWKPTTNEPRWIFDLREEGLELFKHD